MISYPQNADLPDLGINWRDGNGNLIDFTFYTLTVKIAGITPATGSPVTVTKTTGITTNGVNSPNITVQWATTGDLNGLLPGVYSFEILATRNSDSKQRFLNDTLQITPSTF